MISCGNFYFKLASDWLHSVYFLSHLICWRKITCTCTYWYTIYEGIKLGLFVIIIYVMTDSKKTYKNFPNYWKVCQIKCTMEVQGWVSKDLVVNTINWKNGITCSWFIASCDVVKGFYIALDKNLLNITPTQESWNNALTFMQHSFWHKYWLEYVSFLSQFSL